MPYYGPMGNAATKVPESSATPPAKKPCHPECSALLYGRSCDCYNAPGWSTLATLPRVRPAP